LALIRLNETRFTNNDAVCHGYAVDMSNLLANWGVARDFIGNKIDASHKKSKPEQLLDLTDS